MQAYENQATLEKHIRTNLSIRYRFMIKLKQLKLMITTQVTLDNRLKQGKCLFQMKYLQM